MGGSFVSLWFDFDFYLLSIILLLTGFIRITFDWSVFFISKNQLLNIHDFGRWFRNFGRLDIINTHIMYFYLELDLVVLDLDG